MRIWGYWATLRLGAARLHRRPIWRARAGAVAAGGRSQRAAGQSLRRRHGHAVPADLQSDHGRRDRARGAAARAPALPTIWRWYGRRGANWWWGSSASSASSPSATRCSISAAATGDAVSDAILRHRRCRGMAACPWRPRPSSWRPLARRSCFADFCSAAGRGPTRSIWPAIVVISMLWAALHIQYDWIGILQIFVVGLVSRLDALAQRLDPADLPAARVVQSRSHGRDRAAGPIFLVIRNSAHGPGLALRAATLRAAALRIEQAPERGGGIAPACRGRGRLITGSVKRLMTATTSSSVSGLPGVSLTMVAMTLRSRRNSESSAVRVWLMVPR